MGIVLVSQMLWLNFAPLLTLIQERYGVGELAASGLVLVFPLLYVVFSVPAGAMIDQHGYRVTAGAGAIVMAVSALVRIFDGSFAALMAGQIGVAVAQPFVVNGISKLVAQWFRDEEAALATGLGTMGMFLGMAVGMAATPAIVEAASLRVAMLVMFAIAAAAAVAFLAFARENRIPGVETPAAMGGISSVLKDRRFLLVSVISFLGLGVFNALTTWLEPILAENAIGAAEAGIVGGVMILGGIVGAVVIPLLSDKMKRRKPFLVASAAPAVLLTYPLCTAASYPVLLALAFALGFFLLPAFALLLAISGELAGAERAGAATGLVMLTGNAGGVVVSLLVPAVKGSGASYWPAAVLLVALLALTVGLAMLVPETFPGREPPVLASVV